MKIVLSVIIVIISSLVGILISNSYKQKITFFEEFGSFLQHINLKIAFLQEGFSECLHSYIIDNKPKSAFFEKMYIQSKTGQINKRFLIDTLKQVDSSSASDIADIIYSIISSDVEGAKKSILAGIAFTADKINKSIEEYKTKGQVYLKVCICVGVLIAILIY